MSGAIALYWGFPEPGRRLSRSLGMRDWATGSVKPQTTAAGLSQDAAGKCSNRTIEQRCEGVRILMASIIQARGHQDQLLRHLASVAGFRGFPF